MKRIYSLVLAFLLLTIYNPVFSQCEVTASAVPTDIICGNCVTLTAFGEGQGQSVFTEEFNSGAPTGWQTTSQADYTNPCDPGIGGTTHLWMGDATGVPRQLITTPFDFTTATAGATICFDLLFAEQGDASPCEGPDEPDEGVAVQYSINNGVSWIDIHYFDPNGGNDASLINWNNWCFTVPAAALTNNTQFRWFQDNDSGADYDHWGLDNVNIYFNDPTYEIIWSHDSYSYGIGNGGGDNPTAVCPGTTETYVVTMSNGTQTCSDSVTINVSPPTFRVDAGADTSLCAGDCVDVFAEATVVVSPAKTPTYQNNEISILTGLPSASDLASLLIPCVSFSGCNCPDGSTVSFGQTCPTVFQGSLSMNINITDLNTTTLQNGELTSICLNDVLMVVGDLSPFELQLTCPSGSTVILANAGDLAGTTLTNACFDLTSTTPIASGASPYSGSWQPIQPLTNLSGCTANGVWTLTMVGTFDLSSGTLPVGALNGWEISFDDPEISYTGDFSWSPVTNMTNDSTLSPTVCPSSTESYVLSVTDTAGCVTVTDTVEISLDNSCCNFNLDAVVTQPTCANNDGSIDITTSGGSGLFTYNWTSGQGNTQDIDSLAAGTYILTITDTVQDCQKDTTITLANPSVVVIDSASVVDETCGYGNGVIEIFTSASGTILYSIDSGVTTQNSPIFDSLPSGDYDIYIEDASGCTAFDNAIVNNLGEIFFLSVGVVNASCAQDNGEIEIIVNNSATPAYYSIDSGVSTQASNSFDSLSAGNYIAFVEDINGCTFSQPVSITSSAGLNIVSTGQVNGSCGEDTASITLTISGGTSPINYSIDNGVSSQLSNSFDNLSNGTYLVQITDSSGCFVDTSITIDNGLSPVIDSINTTDATCGNNDGAISIGASGGSGALTYSIDAGTSFQPANSFSSVGANLYNIVVEDNNGCQVDSFASVSNSNGPSISNVSVLNGNCGVDTGSIVITVTGGQTPFTYSIDSGASTQSTGTFNNLAEGVYPIVVVDDNSCPVYSVATIDNGENPTISVVANDATCGNNDGEITISASNGQTPYNYSINNGLSFQASNNFTGLAANTYQLVVQDVNGCEVSDSALIENANSPTIDLAVVENESCTGSEDGSIALTISNGVLPYVINWTSGQNTTAINGLAFGNYTVSITDANMCSVDSTFTIQEGINPSVTINNDTSILLGESVFLESNVLNSSSGLYTWSPADGLSCVTCEDPIAAPSTSTTYMLTYIDTPSLCTATASMLIDVTEEETFCLFPDAFSPNDDGVNDAFGPICNDFELIQLTIYNRWGELVYQSESEFTIKKWNGTYKNSDAPIGLYIYYATIKYADGNNEKVSGNVSLIR